MTTSSWYRRNVWQIKGNREYTRTGYEAAQLRFAEGDLDVDCSDRHFMITGANSGLGLETAVEIARRGGILHLVCRNAKSMKEARSHIITTTGNDRIYQHQVNLLRPKDVAKWSEEFLRTHDRLDVLINNAGCLVHERTLDEDGNETHFAVHVLSVHIITSTLIPLLQKSTDPRVVTVSSAGMLTVRLDMQDLNFEKMNPFDGRLAYSQTKRQQVVLSFCYAQRHAGIKFYSMHPGWADTPGVRNSLSEFYEMMKDNLRTPLQGADTIIWLSISEAVLKHPSGLFFQDRTPVATHLPMAWTRHTIAEEQEFMSRLDDLRAKYSTPGLVFQQQSFPPESVTDNFHESEPRTVSENGSVPESVFQENPNSSTHEIGEENRIETRERDAVEEASGAIVTKENVQREEIVENVNPLGKEIEHSEMEVEVAKIMTEKDPEGDSGVQSLSTGDQQSAETNDSEAVTAFTAGERLREMTLNDDQHQQIPAAPAQLHTPQNTPTSEDEKEHLSNLSQPEQANDESSRLEQILTSLSNQNCDSGLSKNSDEGLATVPSNFPEESCAADIPKEHSTEGEVRRSDDNTGERIDAFEALTEENRLQ